MITVPATPRVPAALAYERAVAERGWLGADPAMVRDNILAAARSAVAAVEAAQQGPARGQVDEPTDERLAAMLARLQAVIGSLEGER
ncbi:hypothetical protein [Actinocatenispora comari]|uniref:Uncharacterized protein n=1 Tax=Actinocatenispora comari TaxID=2807577 RepID=A0A8J4AEM1_9ACTN|nr:hypothetical protein [Actinocatenispora comari]GIL29939.1 hypothetical protein NUM_51930 [Actinocatenispora comari]